MAGRVVHFEIPYDDVDRARGFYRDAFGWEVMPLEDYTIVLSGPSGEQGPTESGFINGGLRPREAPFSVPNIVIDVENLEDALEAVTKAGGSTVAGRTPVGEMGFTAYFMDSENNLVGLWETAPAT